MDNNNYRYWKKKKGPTCGVVLSEEGEMIGISLLNHVVNIIRAKPP
jgi:hypothetical protein